jgi:hypothetical protein
MINYQNLLQVPVEDLFVPIFDGIDGSNDEVGLMMVEEFHFNKQLGRLIGSMIFYPYVRFDLQQVAALLAEGSITLTEQLGLPVFYDVRPIFPIGYYRTERYPQTFLANLRFQITF